jgi:hypothetical protein
MTESNETTEPAEVPPVTAAVILIMEPLFKADSLTPYTGDLALFCRSICAYFKQQVEESFSARRGADLAVVVTLRRGEENVGIRYQDGHFLAQEKAEDADTQVQETFVREDGPARSPRLQG